MDAGDATLLALAVATAAHAGFQVTVTVLVYPALVRLGADRWADGHARHSRAITPLVVLAYGALVLGSGLALVEHPSDPWVLVAVAAAGIAVLMTALVAAPTHGRLSAGPDPALLDRLLRADRVRAVAAVVAALSACAAAFLQR